MEDLGGEAEDVVDEEDGDGGGGGAGGVCGGRRGLGGVCVGEGEGGEGGRTAFHAVEVYVCSFRFVVFCNDGWYVAAGLLALVVQCVGRMGRAYLAVA